MTTPLAIVADSIIDFILSLLRDPAAVDELKNDPAGTLARNHLSDVCADDVRAVAPVVYDRPDVMPRSSGSAHNGGTPRNGSDTPPPVTPRDGGGTPRDGNDGSDGVVRELMNIANNFFIDNRSTIVDQSVNQNIWTEGGDVNQLFDQTAAVAVGDGSIAAGDDVADSVEAAAEQAPAVAAEPAQEVAADTAASFTEAPAEVDDAVWDTTEVVLEDEPLYEDDVLEDQ